jgi:hypothetical protein
MGSLGIGTKVARLAASLLRLYRMMTKVKKMVKAMVPAMAPEMIPASCGVERAGLGCVNCSVGICSRFVALDFDIGRAAALAPIQRNKATSENIFASLKC